MIKNCNNKDIINLVYNQKIIDNDDYEIIIELKKKENIIPNENIISNLNESITKLTKELEDMKKSFEKKLQEKEEENITLKKLLGINKSIRKIEPENFHSEPYQLNYCVEIKEVVDGGRGVNDHFAVYNLIKDPKKRVYIAIKNKLENSQSSYISILKI